MSATTKWATKTLKHMSVEAISGRVPSGEAMNSTLMWRPSMVWNSRAMLAGTFNGFTSSSKNSPRTRWLKEPVQGNQDSTTKMDGSDYFLLIPPLEWVSDICGIQFTSSHFFFLILQKPRAERTSPARSNYRPRMTSYDLAKIVRPRTWCFQWAYNDII